MNPNGAPAQNGAARSLQGQQQAPPQKRRGLPPHLQKKKANPLLAPQARRPERPKPPPAPVGARPLPPQARQFPNGLPAFGGLNARPGAPTTFGNDARDTPPPDETPIRINIVTTKRQLMEGLRHHVLRFLPHDSSEVQNIDPTDQSQFMRPVRLHRRDGRADQARLLQAQADANSEAGASPLPSLVPPTGEDKEREAKDAQKVLRQAQKDAIQAEIAPVNKANKKTKKRVEPIFQKAESKQKGVELRYEEALAWHIEDFENKNTWEGAYEQGMSNTSVMFIKQKDAQNRDFFRMVPCDKWYKFSQKGLVKGMSADDAEKLMKSRGQIPRFLLEKIHKQREEEKAEEANRRGRGLKFRAGDRYEESAELARRRGLDDDYIKSEAVPDREDLDYNADEEFQDDDENDLFEGDKDDKEAAQEKIRREQLDANIFRHFEGRDADKEAEEERRRRLEMKAGSGTVKKALRKRERNDMYDSDDKDSDEEKPDWMESETASSSDSDNIDDEEIKKEDDESKKTAEPGSEKAKDAKPEAARNKAAERIKEKGQKKRALPGDASETSGNESSARKKQKTDQQPHKRSGLSKASSITRPGSPTGSASSVGTAGGIKNAKGPLAKVQGGASPAVSRPGSPAPGTPIGANGSPVDKPFATKLPTEQQIWDALPAHKKIRLVEFVRALPGIDKNPDFKRFIKDSTNHKLEEEAPGKKVMLVWRKDEPLNSDAQQ